MKISKTQFDAALAAAIAEMLGDAGLELDHDVDFAEIGLDSLRFTTFVLSFEDRIGTDLPQACIDDLVSAQTLSEVQRVLIKHVVAGA